ncbi:nitroreductase family protein [Chloroflexota bacterium]
MDIPYSRWYAALWRRRSRRHYDPKRNIESNILESLDKACRDFKPFPSARSYLVNKPAADVFKGIVGSYGKVTGASAFIAFIGNMEDPGVYEQVGYTGEAIILEATALGLNTCWVAGFFRPKTVASLIEIKDNERVLAVTPVGYARDSESFFEKAMTGFGLTHRRHPVARLVSGQRAGYLPEWVKTPLEAARIAPSAINRQPWGFEVDDTGITVYIRTGGTGFGVSKRIDCGIAMLHIEVAAMENDNEGKWEFLEGPRIAKYIPI